MPPGPLDNFVEAPTLVDNIPRALVATFPVMHGSVRLASKDLSEKFNTVVCRFLKDQSVSPRSNGKIKEKGNLWGGGGKPRRDPSSIVEWSYIASLILFYIPTPAKRPSVFSLPRENK